MNSLNNELIRLSVGFFIFVSNLSLGSMLYPTPYISITRTIYISAFSVLGCSALTFVVFPKKRNMESLRYKPSFSLYSILIHVYGVGFLIFTLTYCALNTTVTCTWVFLIGLVSIHIDDMLERHEDSAVINILKSLCVVCSVIGVFFTVLKHNELENTENWISIFNIMFLIILPALTPILIHFFRNAQYCTHIREAISDLMHFGMPFASILAVIILVLLHTECMSDMLFTPLYVENMNGTQYTIYNDNSTNLPLFTHTMLPSTILPESSSSMQLSIESCILLSIQTWTNVWTVFFTFYSVLTYQTVDVFCLFSLSILSKFICFYSQGWVAVCVFMSFTAVVKFRLLCCLYNYRKSKEEQIQNQAQKSTRQTTTNNTNNEPYEII